MPGAFSQELEAGTHPQVPQAIGRLLKVLVLRFALFERDGAKLTVCKTVCAKFRFIFIIASQWKY